VPSFPERAAFFWKKLDVLCLHAATVPIRW
jgi:hypothetical protein